MVTQPEESRSKQKMVLISTGAVTVVLALIVLFAAFSPPSPEGVVSGLMDSLAQQDSETLAKYVSGSAQAELLGTDGALNSSRWDVYWDQGGELFDQYRIGSVVISGGDAAVEVYYGPGLIQEEEFLLRKVDGHWKVIDLNQQEGDE